ncbi:ankyrin repeat domain-containing protein [Wolbachia endosymbiont of Kradibia gibbosae]|uniref:ankyrin repeat domain-containing protein n=1 Tax=Wolbachia endosymbiont of Kradibia gibbosae TaxID=2742716 RepID=UPI001F54E249|nr:ankyrin repeat domain-containing protein [Wolbachia endosymbiont of Kradibia gibbosae]
MAREEDINQLVENGFDINSKDASGITLLHKFTKEGDLVGVKSLLEHEADFNVVDNENGIHCIMPLCMDTRKLLNFLLIN